MFFFVVGGGVAFDLNQSFLIPLVVFVVFFVLGVLACCLWLSALLPVLAGAWVGIQGCRAAPRLASWWAKAQIALSACVAVTAVVLLLSWLALGGMSPGLLSQVGTDPLRVAMLLGLEVLAGALVMLSLLHLFRRRL